MQATTAGKILPFFFEYYNLSAYYKTSDVRTPVLARINNALVEAMNKEIKLPRYILIIPDKDILEDAKFDNYKVIELMEQIVRYLANEMYGNIETRKEDLYCKKAGSLLPAEPRIVWVKMLVRPFIQNAKKYVFPYTKRFNEVLNDLVRRKKHSHILEVNMPQNTAMFDVVGNLTNDGMEIFWQEIMQSMKSLDKGETDLQPPALKTKRFKPNPKYRWKKGLKWQKDTTT